jgi:drug/metabolite transporter (DMT)-like permease
LKSTDSSLRDPGSSRQRDCRNQKLVLLWSFLWALSFVAVALGIKRGWLSSGVVTFAAVTGSALLGIATVLAYRRFIEETDELRRKIEVEALAMAFGIGMVGGLSYWLLAISGAVPEKGYAYVFSAMIIIHPVCVLIGRRRYS